MTDLDALCERVVSLVHGDDRALGDDLLTALEELRTLRGIVAAVAAKAPMEGSDMLFCGYCGVSEMTIDSGKQHDVSCPYARAVAAVKP